MVSLQKIKELINKQGKRTSKKAMIKIDNILEEKAEEIIIKAKKNADFLGRRTIKEEDIEI